MASVNGHIEVVELLLQDHRVDPNELHNEVIPPGGITVNQFSDQSLFILVRAFTFPINVNSFIIDWEPRLLEYSREFNAMIHELTVYNTINSTGIHSDIWRYVVNSYM
jgi:hypothetical protein